MRRPPSAARRSAPLAGLGRLSAPHMAPRRCPVRQTPSGCAGPRHRPRAEHAGMSHATRRSAMRSQRGRARAPRLETDALNNRDRHRRAQPLPGRAPALAALQSQWAVLPTRHGCARRGIRGTLIRKSYLFFLPEQRYPAVASEWHRPLHIRPHRPLSHVSGQALTSTRDRSGCRSMWRQKKN